MKMPGTSTLALFACIGLATAAGQVEPTSRVSEVWRFSGVSRDIPAVLHNASAETFDGHARILIYQTTSSTAVAVQALSGSRIHMRPGQTTMESSVLDFPAVRAVTPFLVEWTDGTNRVLGKTAVWVCPTNLLSGLSDLVEPPIAVFDPVNELAPALAAQGLKLIDLLNENVETAQAQMAIVTESEQHAGQVAALRMAQSLSKRGIAVVWIRPPAESRDKLVPSFYTVTKQRGAVVVAKPDLVANFAASPRAQLNLLALAHMAVHPEPFDLPELEIEPTGPK